MNFSSFIFLLLFLPITIIGYFLLNKKNHNEIAKLFLFVMSLWFYAYSDYHFLIILILSILLNFGLSVWIRKINVRKLQKCLLALGIILNLASLLYFKYTNFFEASLNQYLGTSFVLKQIILPLGISFFTFQQIAFLIDAYRDHDIIYSFLDYALFVSFFPKITQGPIALHHEIIPQFHDPKRKLFSYESASKGLLSLSLGFAKKLILADNLGSIADWGYQNISVLGTTNALIVILAYTLQIYFDFSGYCDIASGICLMLNIDLPINFNSPYKSISIDDFWKRWHITLTRFFRNYLYFPMGGSKKGTLRTYFNIFFIFFVSGLWHGAAFTFIVWGIIHGIGMCLSKLTKNIMKPVPVILRWLGTFIFVNIAWIFFRSATLSDAIQMIRQLCSLNFAPLSADMVVIGLPSEFEFLQQLIYL
ncbi:MAG: MBOAT family protein, partial [Clostridia bacterium]|nr:MBOAT family protein [Clostridia bacterium]